MKSISENNPYSRFRHLAGNCWRFATIPFRQYEFSMNDMRTIFGSSFGSEGWNHIISTLKDYENNPSIDFHDTDLYRFHKKFTPRSICDFVSACNCDLPLFHYPWGTFNIGSKEKDAWDSRFCGPSTDVFIKAEFDRIISLYNELKKSWYKPWHYGNSFIGGTVLIAVNDEKRFVVMQGNHRAAILSFLGYKSIKVRIYPEFLLTKVYEKKVKQWENVINGRCNINDALSIFRLFFDENGYHIKRRIASKAL